MIDLKIHQTFGRIGLDIRDAEYQLGIPKPNVNIKQNQPQVELERTDPVLKINYSPMLESIGYGDIEYMKERFVEEAKADYLAGVEKSARMSNAFASLENKLSVSEIVIRFNKPSDKDLTLQPLAPIEISAEPGTLRYQAQPGDVWIDSEFEKVSIENYQFASVKSYLEQKPELKIEAVGQIFDQKK